MIEKFRYHSENMAYAKFSLPLRNFAILAKFLVFLSENHCSSCIASCINQSAFLHFQLDISSSRLDEIAENPYELSIKHHNYDAKLYMMAKVPKTCKTTENKLETKSAVLIGPAHVNWLN